MSFAACNVLNLPSRQLQAVLACLTEERFAGVGQILSRVEGWNNASYKGDEDIMDLFRRRHVILYQML